MWSPRRLTLLAFLLGCILAFLFLMAAFTLHVSKANCERVAHIDMIIQEQGQRSLKTLGKEGGVGFAYYQVHPGELAVARAQFIQQIKDFNPPKCSGIF